MGKTVNNAECCSFSFWQHGAINRYTINGPRVYSTNNWEVTITRVTLDNATRHFNVHQPKRLQMRNVAIFNAFSTCISQTATDAKRTRFFKSNTQNPIPQRDECGCRDQPFIDWCFGAWPLISAHTFFFAKRPVNSFLLYSLLVLHPARAGQYEKGETNDTRNNKLMILFVSQ